MSCEGCIASKQERDKQLNQTILKAKEYAIENQKDVAIYKEGEDWKFAEAEFAITSRFNIREVLSFYK